MIICEMNSQWKSSGSTIIIWNIVSDEKVKPKGKFSNIAKRQGNCPSPFTGKDFMLHSLRKSTFLLLLAEILEPGSKKVSECNTD